MRKLRLFVSSRPDLRCGSGYLISRGAHAVLEHLPVRSTAIRAALCADQAVGCAAPLRVRDFASQKHSLIERRIRIGRRSSFDGSCE